MDPLPSCGPNVPVPSSLNAVFAGRVLITDLAQQFILLKAKVLALKDEPCAAKLDFALVCRHLDYVQTILGGAVPHAQCGCYQKPCPLCKDAKWISVREYLSAVLPSQPFVSRDSSSHPHPWRPSPALPKHSPDSASRQEKTCTK